MSCSTLDFCQETKAFLQNLSYFYTLCTRDKTGDYRHHECLTDFLFIQIIEDETVQLLWRQRFSTQLTLASRGSSWAWSDVVFWCLMWKTFKSVVVKEKILDWISLWAKCVRSFNYTWKSQWLDVFPPHSNTPVMCCGSTCLSWACFPQGGQMTVIKQKVELPELHQAVVASSSSLHPREKACDDADRVNKTH